MYRTSIIVYIKRNVRTPLLLSTIINVDGTARHACSQCIIVKPKFFLLLGIAKYHKCCQARSAITTTSFMVSTESLSLGPRPILALSIEFQIIPREGLCKWNVNDIVGCGTEAKQRYSHLCSFVSGFSIFSLRLKSNVEGP